MQILWVTTLDNINIEMIRFVRITSLLTLSILYVLIRTHCDNELIYSVKEKKPSFGQISSQVKHCFQLSDLECEQFDMTVPHSLEVNIKAANCICVDRPICQ